MRLSKLKLSGFKSFVDPTTVLFPSELTGVVGPNGCGKSNIIDAVRWVMGESSAKHLRGDSMADVIFNGSATRKPVGQAAVELVFDNSEGKLGGQYANYNEISVKRAVTRDGQSHYYLNGTRCRRRDITDIFLGTGLGARSYAIIEQGTISRIIEAKPEELRIFLEEAAGISKYKERRRETENRIRHTRDNLDRLNDIRDELEKQINHLQRQAKTAEKYKVLKEEQRLLNAQLLALKWKQLNDKAETVESKIRDKETALESARANQRHVEADIEKQRESNTEANESFNQIQSRYYSVGSEIARLEQAIQHAKERRQQQQSDLEQLLKDLTSAQSHSSTDRKRIDQLRQELSEIEPSLQSSQSDEQSAVEKLEAAETAMHEWQQEWAAFNQRAAEPAQVIEVERARISHLDERLSQLKQRMDRLEQEVSSISADALEEQVAKIHSVIEQGEEKIKQHAQKLQQQVERINELRDIVSDSTEKLERSRDELQTLRSKQASLKALQQAALGKEQTGVVEWLDNQNLGSARRLAESIEVESGWEQAAECVLGHYLEAVCVDGIDNLVNSLGKFAEGQLMLLDTHTGNPVESGDKAATLASKITSDLDLHRILAGTYAVATLQEAMQLRTQLSANESVVTKEGIWFGPNWLRIVKESDEHTGILHREHDLKVVSEAIEQHIQAEQTIQAQLDAAREELKTLEDARDLEQIDQQQATRDHAEQQAQYSALKAKLEQTKSRRDQLEHELNEVRTQIEKDTEERTASEERLSSAQNMTGDVSQQREQLTKQREELQQQLEQARNFNAQVRDVAHEVKVRSEKIRTELDSTQQALQRMDTQMAQLEARREELNTALGESEEPITLSTSELDILLKQRVEVETELGDAREKVQAIEQQIRNLEEQRTKAEEHVQEVRGQLEEIRIGWQEVKVRRQTIQEQIVDASFQTETLLAEMPQEATLESWTEEVAKMDRRISRLGAINLAAIEEFEQQSERKTYLDAQYTDLMEALQTLENAIAKIDKETRTRFQETYDKVNSGLKELFPRLFGGGHAYLEMTGEDLLETGIAVMARPPGKRNSTIHLLSGGEKALTAIALVFAIFELNPAPFCMLDEVDAPLDDLNVGRYCDMVKHMSDRIQFVFITHNKITMEVANHLTGVTMNEPGVSRLVAVDVDEAVKLAAV